jgi:DNA gyrase subunit A
MKDDVEEILVDEDGNIIVSEIERVKPVLEVLEDEGGDDEEEDDDETEDDIDEDSDDSDED